MVPPTVGCIVSHLVIKTSLQRHSCWSIQPNVDKSLTETLFTDNSRYVKLIIIASYHARFASRKYTAPVVWWLRKGATLLLMKPQPSRTHSLVLLPMKLTVALFSRQFLMELVVVSRFICKISIDAQVSGKHYCNQSRKGPVHHHCHHLPEQQHQGLWLLCSTQRDPKY